MENISYWDTTTLMVIEKLFSNSKASDFNLDEQIFSTVKLMVYEALSKKSKSQPFESNSETSDQLGKRLRNERERLKLTQEEFGHIANVSKRTIIDWEKGNTFPNALQLLILTKIGLNINTLLDRRLAKHEYRLIYNDINFGEKFGDYVLKATDRISGIFAQYPEYKLLNIETKYAKNGDSIGLRYFYFYPVIEKEHFGLDENSLKDS